MAPFSVTDAATAGFAVIRRKPRALIVWGGVALVAIVAMVITFFLLGADHLKVAAEALQSGALEDPQVARQVYAPLFPAYGASLAIGLVAYSILMPAVYRAVLDTEGSSPGYVRFGLAEVRQFGVLAVIMAIVMGINLATGSLAVAISGGTGIVAFVLSLASFLAIIFILVRLSLAGPDTLAKSKLSFAGSWKLSKGVYGPLLASFALALLFQFMIAVASVLIMVVVVGITAMAEQMGPARIVVISAIMVAYLVIICLIYALSVAVVAAPAAHVYRALTSTKAQA